MMGNTDAWLQCVENEAFLKYFEDTGSLSMNESWDRPQGFGLEKLKACPSGFPRDWPYVRYLRLKRLCALAMRYLTVSSRVTVGSTRWSVSS